MACWPLVPSQRGSEASFDASFHVRLANYWTNNRVAGDLRHPDFYVTSPWWLHQQDGCCSLPWHHSEPALLGLPFKQKYMMTSSNGNIFRVTGLLCGEFTGHRWIPRTKASARSFDVFFGLRLNKQLSKQSWGWWFETPSCSLWRKCNGMGQTQLQDETRNI